MLNLASSVCITLMVILAKLLVLMLRYGCQYDNRQRQRPKYKELTEKKRRGYIQSYIRTSTCCLLDNARTYIEGGTGELYMSTISETHFEIFSIIPMVLLKELNFL